MPWFRRRAFLPVIAVAALALGGGLVAQLESGDRGIPPIDSSGTLEVDNIHVDVGSDNPQGARYAGWRIAQRQGFRALWAKLHGGKPDDAPILSDATLDGLVSSVVVEGEQIGPNRYIADLGILFDRARAGELLGVGGAVHRSAPLLLIPVVVSGGTETSVELRNVWQRAWAQYRTSNSAIDYVRVSGLGVDPLLVNAAQAARPGRAAWRNILDLYGAANLLVAEVQLHRIYPGGPAKARFIGRFGADSTLLGSFSLTARDSADLPRMMAEGAERMDQLFTAALDSGRIRSDSSLVTQAPPPTPEDVAAASEPTMISGVTDIQLLLTAPDAATLSASTAQLRGVAGVDGVSETSLAVGGTSQLVISYRGDSGALRAALMALGWAVDDTGGVLRVTRSAVSVAPTPPPAPVAPPAPPR